MLLTYVIALDSLMNKILLVDDSLAVLSALKDQISSDTLIVQTASSVRNALKLIEVSLPDCILTDYEMPDTDGPAFCRLLKSDRRFQQIPVIMLTSMTSSDSLLTAIEAGADDFISKDSDIRIIIAKISAMLRLKANQDEVIRLRRVEGIKQIIATYNHEFNNPLTIALGNLNWLKRNSEEQEYRVRLERLGDALQRMTELVKKIRELRDYVESKYAAGESIVSISESTEKKVG